MMNKKESFIYYMNRNQNKLMIYEDNLLPKIFFIQTDAKPKRREVGIAIYTPIDSDKGISHVIEHCIASELYSRRVWHTIKSKCWIIKTKHGIS